MSKLKIILLSLLWTGISFSQTVADTNLTDLKKQTEDISIQPVSDSSTVGFKEASSKETSNVTTLGSNVDTTSVRSKKLSAKFSNEENGFDTRLFRMINNHRGSFQDVIMPYFDKSAPPMALIMPLSMIAYGRLSKNTYDENTGFLLGISQGVNLFTTFGLKFLFKRDRPGACLDNVNCTGIGNTDPYSFPSGHTSVAFNMATMFNLRYPNYPQVYIPMYLYSLIVAYGRPYYGMHFPSDLLGGALIGAGSAALVFSLRTHLLKFKNNIMEEDMEDVGSINGKTIAIFGGSFVVSSVVGQFLFKDSEKVKLSVLPYGRGNEKVSLSLKIKL